MIILGNLFLSGRDWMPWILGLVLLSWCLLAVGYWRSPLGGRMKWLALLLKGLGMALLGFCLLEPLWSQDRARPGANYVAVMVDDSQSMTIQDLDSAESRGVSLRRDLVNDVGGWQVELKEDFMVRPYRFAQQLQTIKDFGEVQFEGSSSSLLSSLSQMKDRYRSRPLAAVLLFTDGNATDAEQFSEMDWSSLPPIYPVLVGDSRPLPDLTISKVSISQTAFEDAPVSVHVNVSPVGYEGEGVTAQLWDDQGRLVLEATETSGEDRLQIPFHFQLRPETIGVSFYRLRVFAVSEQGVFEGRTPTREATLLNNEQILAVDRGREVYRILYVAGHPNWEYKFLQRALSEDQQVQLVALIRIAKKEPKFQFKGRQGESSNPLFRGFDQTGEDTERYDQPVLSRLNTLDDRELKDGFPKVAGELYPYSAVILDNVESAFFTRDQMALLENFVSERGGGFLMLGGYGSFQHGAYERTPIADLLPVYLDTKASVAPGTTWSWQLTREGWLEPWARLRDVEEQELFRLRERPPYQILNVVERIKPGARVLARVADSGGESHPAFVSQRYGYGQSAALMIGDFWRGRLVSNELREDTDKAWRQMIRWLVSDVPQRVELKVEEDLEHGSAAMKILLKVRNTTFLPESNAQIALKVFEVPMKTPMSADEAERVDGSPVPSPDDQGVLLQTQPSGGIPGQYETLFSGKPMGAYRIESVVLDEAGKELGRPETGWGIHSGMEEFRETLPNRGLMESIASATGGRLLTLEDLPSWVRELNTRDLPVMETTTRPIWHHPLILLAAFTCLVLEWGIRRWHGLR